MKKRMLSIFLVVLIFLNIGVIFYNSNETSEQSTSASRQISRAILKTDRTNSESVKTMHKFNTVLREVSHAIEFFPMGVLCAWLCLLHLTLKKKYLISSLLSFLFVLLNAFADEIHQIFVPGRSFQISDILTDCIGGLAGIATGFIIAFIIVKLKSKMHKMSG